jgi:hypothetical protein
MIVLDKFIYNCVQMQNVEKQLFRGFYDEGTLYKPEQGRKMLSRKNKRVLDCSPKK